MFYPGSRYANMATYTITLPDGSVVSAVRLPPPGGSPVLGYHPRQSGQRLDHIASHYQSDPTAFWRLCDVNDAVVPDALAAHAQIAIPRSGS